MIQMFGQKFAFQKNSFKKNSSNSLVAKASSLSPSKYQTKHPDAKVINESSNDFITISNQRHDENRKKSVFLVHSGIES